MAKVSIRFYNDIPVRAIWNDEKNTWYFSVLDVLFVIRAEPVYEKNRNYWKYLKAKLKRENSQLVSVTTQLKISASDGKKYLSDVVFEWRENKKGKMIETFAQNVKNKGECRNDFV